MVAAKKVHVGLVGLGKMGNNMRARMRKAGLKVTGYDPNPAVTDVPDLAALVAALPAPRIVWVMVPSGPITTSVITDLAAVLGKGDLVIDGGNSRFTDDTIHAALLAEKGIRFVDCGVSGGIWGLKNGYGLMAGGDKRDIARAMPLFDALRPAGPRAEGFVHAGTDRRRPLREDGAQRHRVRADAGARRGLRAARCAQRPHPRRHRRLQGVAARNRRAQLAARAAREGARGGSRPRRTSRATSRTRARVAGP